MGKIKIKERIKQWLATIGFKLFLWGNAMTKEEYWNEIYEQEMQYQNSKSKCIDNLKSVLK